MDAQKQMTKKVGEIIASLPQDAQGWVGQAALGQALSQGNVNYKQMGFPRLRDFIESLQDTLELREDIHPGKTPVLYVRLLESKSDLSGGLLTQASGDGEAGLVDKNLQNHRELKIDREQVETVDQEYRSGRGPKPELGPGQADPQTGAIRIPGPETWFYEWAAVPPFHWDNLAELALPEKWYYGEEQPEKDKYPILRNYLVYTFNRLCREGKIRLAIDQNEGEEYAAFNTGLVDRKYEYIYALFKVNTRWPKPYWYLKSFVVPGEDDGKTLVALFNPLPERADYFNNKIENMLFDSNSGVLSCDYTHILVERTSRLPHDFFYNNCPPGFLEIEGYDSEQMFSDKCNDRGKKAEYFRLLGQKIQSDMRVMNYLINRLQDAVDLAVKRSEWNYKTAIPMYFPKGNTMSLLLPLALVDDNRIDLALVIDRQQSGSYIGQTVLALDLAYTNSRLITRPDSDWLRAEDISSENDGLLDQDD